MSTDVVALIDGAIEDWETSDDAMRWRPEGGAPPRLHRFSERAQRQLERSIVRAGWTPSGVILDEVDELSIPTFDELRAAGLAIERMGGLAEVGRIIIDGLMEGLSAAGRECKALAEAIGLVPEPATHEAISPKVPRYTDDRPRWQSPYGPARRR